MRTATGTRVLSQFLAVAFVILSAITVVAIPKPVAATTSEPIVAGGVGACCLRDYTCIIVSQDSCNAICLAQYLGDGSDCSDCYFPPIDDWGACCLPDGSCLETDLCDCLARDGSPLGFMTACEGGQCPWPYEACCFPDGTCEVTAWNTCPGSGGVGQGDGTTCTTFECSTVPRGACCFPGGTCAENTFQEICELYGGRWGGEGSDCAAACVTPTSPESWGRIKRLFR